MGYIEVFWSLESQPDYLNTFHIELPYIEVEGPRIRIELSMFTRNSTITLTCY